MKLNTAKTSMQINSLKNIEIKKEYESYEAFIMNQYEHADYFDVTEEKLLQHICKNSNINEALWRKKIEGIYNIHKRLVGSLPRLIELAFVDALRFSTDEIEEIKDKIFLSPKNKLAILKRELERFENKYSKLNLGDRFDLIDECSIKNTIFKIVFDLRKELVAFPLATMLEINQTTDYFREPIILKIRTKNNLEWIKSMLQEQNNEVNSVGENSYKQHSISEKIKIILTPLGNSFEDDEHINIIINAFIEFKLNNQIPEHPKKKAINIKLDEFLRPFRTLFEQNIIKRGEICKLLLYFIEKNTMSDPDYSEAYLNKLLSNRHK